MYVKQRKPSYAPEHYEHWTPETDRELAVRKASGESNKVIAAAMGRTFKSVKFRWERRIRL